MVGVHLNIFQSKMVNIWYKIEMFNLESYDGAGRERPLAWIRPSPLETYKVSTKQKKEALEWRNGRLKTLFQ